MGFLDTSARIRASIMEKLPTLPDNFRATLAQGVADFAIGETFCSAETGSTRRYERIAAAPGYQDMGDGAAPPTRASVVSTDAPQVLSGAQRSTARSNIGAIDKDGVPIYYSRGVIPTIAVPADIAQLSVAGYNKPGDRGDATFKRVDAEPAHPGKVRDKTGAWFEQVGPECRPQQFGGFPGSANATPAFIAADACAKALGGWVSLVGDGIWSIADFVQTCRWIFGQGRLLTRVRRAFATTLAVWSLANGASGMTVQDLTIDAASGDEPKSILSLGDFRNDILIQRVGFENGMNRWALRGDPTAQFQRLGIVDCYFKNCPQGGLIILSQVGARGSRTVRINRNTFDQVGGNICSIRGAEAADGRRWNGIVDVQGNDNTVTNCLNTGTDGPIPFEFWGCSDGQHLRNKIDSGTRGLGMGAEMQNFEIAFNDVANQTAYAVEGGTCRNVWIHHNTARNCRTFCPIPSSNETDNLVIEDNTLDGTALKSYTPANPADVIFVGGYARGLRIRRNVIRNPEYARAAISTTGISGPLPAFSINGGGSGATASVTLKAVRVRLRSGNGGSGYTDPVVTVDGGGGTGMAITATIVGGVLTGGVITNPGTGYTRMPTAIITDPTGLKGELEILMGVEAVTATGGSGYASSSWSANRNGAIVSAAGTFTATNGVPGAFVVTNPGEGFGRVSDAIIDACEVICDTYASAPVGIIAAGNTMIRNPIVRRSAPYDSNHYFAKLGGAAVQITPAGHGSAAGNPYSIVENPICEMTGAVEAGVPFMGIGLYAAAQPLYGFELRGGGKVSGNYPTGAIYLPDTSGTAKIGAIDVTGVTGNPYGLNASILRRRTGEVIEGTAAPTTGTWRTGAIVEHSAPTDSSPIRWTCIAGGSPGIWAARSGAGSEPIMSGYQTLAAYTTSRRLVVLANPATNTLKIRSEAPTGAGQTSAALRIFWSGRYNNIPRGGEVTIAYGTYDKSDASPVPAQIGDAVTIANAVDATGRLETTITFPVSAAPWLTIEGITNVPSAWSRLSAQAS